MTNGNIVPIFYKEYLLINEKLRRYGTLLFLYWCFAFVGLYPIWVAVCLTQGLGMLSIFSLFAQEVSFVDYSHAPPFGPRECVIGRYRFALCLLLLSSTWSIFCLALFQILGSGTGEITNALKAGFSVSMLGLWLWSLVLPIFYAYGHEKARPWFFLLILVPVGLFVVNSRYLGVILGDFWSFSRVVFGICTSFFALYLSQKESLRIVQRGIQ